MAPIRLTTELILRWAGIALVTLIIVLLVKIPEEGFTIKGVAVVGINTLVFWNMDYQLIRYFRLRYHLVSQTGKRLLYSLGAILGCTLVVHFVLCSLLGFFGLIEDASISNAVNFLPTSLISTSMVTTLYESIYFFQQWRQTAVEAEQLRTQQLRSELEVLKTQISPHFLFNSLNTLVTLIEEDQRQAVAFTQKLSEVYRYILQNKEEEMVSLERELRFTESYVFLLKMRFADNFHVYYSLPDEYMTCYVPPMTLQILIENAIKHNIVSVAKPLSIDIFVQNGETLQVRNNYQPKTTAVASTHTGLSNVRRRFEYLSKREVQVIHTLSHFEVVMPLVHVQDYQLQPAL